MQRTAESYHEIDKLKTSIQNVWQQTYKFLKQDSRLKSIRVIL